MGNSVNYLSQIQTGQTIQAVHVSQFVDAFTGSVAYDLITSGSFTIIGPLTATASAANTVYIGSNASTDTNYTLVFKNSSGALGDFYQLAADGTNGPYYNPATNVLGGVGGLTISGSVGKFNSITGSLLGNINGSSSYATTASYALTSSYASNGVSNLSVGTFYDTTSQTVLSGASASITLNTPVISDGISVASNSRLTVTRAGIYNLQFSAQIITTTGGSPDLHIWLRKNGTNVANSNTGVTLKNQNENYVAAWNFVESLNPGEYLELVWYVNGGISAQLSYDPPSPTNGGVGVPSVIVTMTQIK